MMRGPTPGNGAGPVLVIFWLALAAWMYKKAVQFNMNGLFWLIIGLVTNVVGVAALFIVRSALYEKCPSCGTWQKKSNLFCTACGAEWKRRRKKSNETVGYKHDARAFHGFCG